MLSRLIFLSCCSKYCCFKVGWHVKEAERVHAGPLQCSHYGICCSEWTVWFSSCFVLGRKDCVSHLVVPCASVLDDSIGCAVWFAARGRGRLLQLAVAEDGDRGEEDAIVFSSSAFGETLHVQGMTQAH